MIRPELFSFTWVVRRTACAQVSVERGWVSKYLKNKKDNKKTQVQIIIIYLFTGQSMHYIYIYIIN